MIGDNQSAPFDLIQMFTADQLDTVTECQNQTHEFSKHKASLGC